MYVNSRLITFNIWILEKISTQQNLHIWDEIGMLIIPEFEYIYQRNLLHTK